MKKLCAFLLILSIGALSIGCGGGDVKKVDPKKPDTVKPGDKPADKPADKPEDKPADKPEDKPAE